MRVVRARIDARVVGLGNALFLQGITVQRIVGKGYSKAECSSSHPAVRTLRTP